MKELIAIAVGVLMVLPLPILADSTLEETVETLTIITSPDFEKRTQTKKRFRFILPVFVERCTDIDQTVRAGDMIAVLYKELDNAGLTSEEGFFMLANNLHRMTMAISVRTQSSNIPLRCVEVWAMYVTLRLQGMGSVESREGVEQIVIALHAATQ